MVTSNLKRPTRRVAILGAGLAIAGCTNSNTSGLKQAVKLLDNSLSGQSFTTGDVVQAPYASIGVKEEGGAEAMLILARASEDELLWMAEDRTVMATRHGRVTRLIGLGTDVVSAAQTGQDPVADGQISKNALQSCVRAFDITKMRRYGTLAKSMIEEVGTQPVQLLYGAVMTRLFVETGTCEPLNWRFRNEFYFHTPSNRILQSIQQVSPDLPSLTIRILRPYDGAAA